MSVQAVPRNYSLSGGHQDAVELDDDRIVERMEETWWKPKLSRQQMREIMQRRDGPALRHYGLWFFLLAVSAYLAVVSWGTWWAIPAFLIYGTIYSSSDASWHECGHGTPFRTHWLNELLYHISSFMTFREAYMWRWSHSRHHTHTYIVGRDPEIQVQRPADLLKIAMDFFYIRSGPPKSGASSATRWAGPTRTCSTSCPNANCPRCTGPPASISPSSPPSPSGPSPSAASCP